MSANSKKNWLLRGLGINKKAQFSKSFDLKTFEALESLELKTDYNIDSMGSTTDGVVYLTDSDDNLYICEMGGRRQSEGAKKKRRDRI